MGENREILHELRRKAHEAGIEGNSTMTVEELRTALAEIQKGRSPQEAMAAAKQH